MKSPAFRWGVSSAVEQGTFNLLFVSLDMISRSLANTQGGSPISLHADINLLFCLPVDKALDLA